MFQASPQVCPTCQAVAPPNQRFCANCGATLPNTSANIAAAPFSMPMGYAPTVPPSDVQPGSGPVPPSPYTQYPANPYNIPGTPPPYSPNGPYMPAPGYGYAPPQKLSLHSGSI